MTIEKEVEAKESPFNAIGGPMVPQVPLEVTVREGLSETDKLLALLQYTFIGEPTTLNPDARAGCYLLMDIIRARIQEIGLINAECP